MKGNLIMQLVTRSAPVDQLWEAFYAGIEDDSTSISDDFIFVC